MSILFFDIETMPTKDPEIIKQISETIKPPGNIKKTESIAAWMDEKFNQALIDAVKETSLDGLYGGVACIGWSYGDGEVSSSGLNQTEAETIKEFYGCIVRDVTKFCGHNIQNFDLQFLKHRSIILGIRPPNNLLMAMNAKPWSDWVADTMIMWDSSKQNMVSMYRLCKAFGIDGKGDFNGSMVAETWEKDPQKVIEYCLDDVRRTMQIYKRMTFE